MPRMGEHRRRRRGLCGLVLLLPLIAAAAALPTRASDRSTCRYLSQLPDDCADAESRKFSALRGYRYEEIDLFARDVIKKVPYVSIYNTTGQNDGDDTRDSAPASFAEHVDPKKIAKQYQAVSVTISPPRYWALDWFVDRVGAVRNFDGLDAAWMGNGPAAQTEFAAKKPSNEYRPFSFPRTSIEGFRRGSKVYLLDDPTGRTWILTSYTSQASPGAAIDGLDTLGDRLKTPQGWKFRTATLGRDLILEPKGGLAVSTEDDKGDVYHLTGPGQSVFKP